MLKLVLLGLCAVVVAHGLNFDYAEEANQVYFDEEFSDDEISDAFNGGGGHGGHHGRCNATKLGQCSGPYYQDLGFNGTRPNSTREFFHAIYRLLRQGPAGFNKLCQANSRYEQCVGGESAFYSCINPWVLHHRFHLPRRAAYAVSIFFNETKYSCGPDAHDTIVSNWNCIGNVSHNNRTQHHWRQCVHHFYQAIHHHPDRRCQIANHYAHCIARPFNHCSHDLAKVFCHRTTIGLKFFFHRCRFNCNRGGGGGGNKMED